MVKKLIHGCIGLICLMLFSTAQAAGSWPTLSSLEAKSWALIDAKTGTVLSSHHAEQELPPASLTKLMTLYLIFEDLKRGALNLDESVDVSEKAWRMGGSRMFIEPRQHPTVEQLMHGIATASGNDACVAMAEHIAGSESAFVDRMNEKAASLGLTHSHFRNATGFPAEGHHSSAGDMARLATAIWRDFPDYYTIFAEKSFTYNGIHQPNRNRLMQMDKRVDGLKTGHTQEAGYCLVSSAEDQGFRLVAAVFGSKSDYERARQSRILLNFGFHNFSTLQAVKRHLRREVKVYQGKQDSLWLVPEKAIRISIPRGYEKRVKFRLSYQSPLIAPIQKGQKIGQIEAILDAGSDHEKVLSRMPMLAATDIAQASWISRQFDAIGLWWSGDDAQGKPQ